MLSLSYFFLKFPQQPCYAPTNSRFGVPYYYNADVGMVSNSLYAMAQSFAMSSALFPGAPVFILPLAGVTAGVVLLCK